MPIISIDMVLSRIIRGHTFIEDVATKGDQFDWFAIPEDVRYHFVHKQLAHPQGFHANVFSVIKATDPLTIKHLIGRINGPM